MNDNKEKKNQGIKLPNALLDEINNDEPSSIHQPRLKRNRTSQASRKEQRKLERQNKKQKRGGSKSASVDSQVKKNQSHNVGNVRTEKMNDSEDDDENHSDEDDFEGFESELSSKDTWEALKASKASKNGKIQQDAHPEQESASVEDTWAALKAAKEKKNKNKNLIEGKLLIAEESKTKSLSKRVDDTLTKTNKEENRTREAVREIGSEITNKQKKSSSLPKKLPRRERVISEREKHLMAQDEEDIGYYSKKLKLKSLKLSKNSSVDDGLDDILGGLDFERFASGSETEDSEVEGDENDQYISSEDIEDNSNDIVNDNDNDSENESESENEIQPVIKENPYVAPVALSNTIPSSGKYIPPSKRKSALEQNGGESEEMVHLRRQVKGQLNKLTESNIGSIVNEIESLYLRHSRSLTSSIITAIVLESITLQGTLNESFLILHAAFVTALYRTIGVEFGAHFVQTLVESFERHNSNGISGKEASNLLSLLSEIYTFQLISCKLMYDFIREFLKDISETNTDYLLKIVRNSGPQLRSDDPASLKDIIYLLQAAVSKAEPTTINSRTKFLIESITTLKNNRQKIASETSISSVQRMKKFLGSISGLAKEPLHVSLDDIHNIDKKGKWWIVGAAWNNNNGAISKGPDVDIAAVNDILDTAEPNWMELAKIQRMNTDVRKAVFVALMSSEDYADSCERLDKLRLKSKQEREIPRVILHCCSNEEAYNPFYAFVAGKLCKQHSLKKTFQFCLWDFLGELQGDDHDNSDDDDNSDKEGEGLGRLVNKSRIDERDLLRRTGHLARLYASIVAQGEMTLDVLKAADFLTSVTEVKIFLEFFFITLFDVLGKRAEKDSDGKTKKNGFGQAMFGKRRDEKELAQLLIKTKDQTVLRGVQYFQKFVAVSSIMPTKQKQQERILWGSKVTSDLIEGLLTN